MMTPVPLGATDDLEGGFTPVPMGTDLGDTGAAFGDDASVDDAESDQPALPKRQPGEGLSPAQKAAAVLALLDENTLQRLSGRVPERHRGRLIESVRTLRSLSSDEQRSVANEFIEKIKRERNSVRMSGDTEQRLAGTLFFQPTLAGFTEDLTPTVPEEPIESVWSRVAKCPVDKLVQFFTTRPATVLAIALANLPEDVGSEIAAELPEDLVKDTMVQVAATRSHNPLAVESVEKLLENTLLGYDEEEAEDDTNQNADRVASILNRMVSSRRTAVLEELRERLDEESLAEIMAKVLDFDDLEHRLPRNAIPVLFREIPEKSFLMAIKHSINLNKTCGDYLLANISQRMAAQYREKMEEMPALTDIDGEKAQSALVCQVLNMVDDGTIKLLEKMQDAE